jgi:hypothetical protein
MTSRERWSNARRVRGLRRERLLGLTLRACFRGVLLARVDARALVLDLGAIAAAIRRAGADAFAISALRLARRVEVAFQPAINIGQPRLSGP